MSGGGGPGGGPEPEPEPGLEPPISPVSSGGSDGPGESEPEPEPGLLPGSSLIFSAEGNAPNSSKFSVFIIVGLSDSTGCKDTIRRFSSSSILTVNINVLGTSSSFAFIIFNTFLSVSTISKSLSISTKSKYLS